MLYMNCLLSTGTRSLFHFAVKVEFLHAASEELLQIGLSLMCTKQNCTVTYMRHKIVGIQVTEEGVYLEPLPEGIDRRTAAEKKYDEQLLKREQERVAKMAQKSHREKVAEFNAYLENLSEHHDIPKVGPG